MCISPSKAQKHEGHPVKTLPNALYFSRRYKTNVQDVFLFIAYFTKRLKNPVTGSRAPSLEKRERLLDLLLAAVHTYVVLKYTVHVNS